MLDIAVFVPLHTFNDEMKEPLERALRSIQDVSKVVVSIPNKFQDEFLKLKVIEELNPVIMFLGEDDATDFCSQVNRFVETIDNKWFSILEFDDYYTPIWFKDAEQYIDSKPDTGIFLPLVEFTEWDTNQMISFGNEVVWASSYSEEIGYIEHDTLEGFSEYNLTGGIFNREEFVECGKLKPSIKIAFWNEFMLRYTNKGHRIFVVPKIGYVHNLGRKDSLVELYKETISLKEAKWWQDLAKTEYFFDEDRHKTYNPELMEKAEDLK